MRELQEEGDGASNEGTWRPLRVGNLRGLFLWSQEVLRSVWVDVWVDNACDFRKASHSVLFEINSENTLSVFVDR